MLAHSTDELLPESIAALCMDAVVADHREFLGARRDENQDAIALFRFLHPKLNEFLLGAQQWIFFEHPALEENPNLPGRFRFGGLDRVHDSVVLELPNKFMRAHPNSPAAARSAAAKTAATATKPTESPARR
jgi:hypothetical protein